MSDESESRAKTGSPSAAATTTTTTTAAAAAEMTSVVPGGLASVNDDDEDTATFGASADMDLVNGPNPWLPAYGFQLQHHSQFQPTHEDLRANDTVLVQQVDFLETILEETSDDLQSDSDRSGTTYWMGSDSETESVIHIRSKQRSADERLDGSGSECNSVVPKKRRRRNNGSGSDREHQVTFEDFPLSPRSSRSSDSSRSSSLLQFESLERTCATLSPSSYSFDSLEYSNRSNASHPENTSPDSLEQDYDRVVTNGFAGSQPDQFPRIRPYRSFESLDACQKDDDLGGRGLSNGFAPLYLKRGSDLSRTGRSNQCRDFWHEEDEYEDDEEYEEDLDPDERLSNDTRTAFEDRLMVFGDQTCNYATTLDYRNTIDLREIGVETKRDTLLDLKSGQAAVSTSLRLLHARLNIAGNMAHGRNNMVADHHHNRHHHHHHHHHQEQSHHHHHHSAELDVDDDFDLDEEYEKRHRHRQREQHQQQQQQQTNSERLQGWSKEESFNFRFTDKSQSAPSLPSSVDESGHSPRLLAAHTSSRTTSFVSTSNLFENYTRVASVPVDLNLCGVYCQDQDDARCSDVSVVSDNEHEMADVRGGEKRVSRLENSRSETDSSEDTKNTLLSSVRTQAAQGSLSDAEKMRNDVGSDEETKECVGEHCEKKNQVTSTVKTQDHGKNVLEMAIAMEDDIDAVMGEAIRQLKREVEEATNSGIADGIQRSASARQRTRRVKNNASYELAQQFEVDERTLRRMPACKEEDVKGSPRSSNARKRVVNNASYELAQQCDYIKALKSRGAFHRMDACDELDESGRSSRLKVSDMVEQMSGGSASNLSSGLREPMMETRTYSRSTENIPTGRYSSNESSKPRRREQQEESLLTQIKKNSDLFSIYGEGASARALVDDEVDYPCLETKPIGIGAESGCPERAKPREDRSLEYRDKDNDSSAMAPQDEPEEDSSILEAVSKALQTSFSYDAESTKKFLANEISKELMERQREKEESAEKTEALESKESSSLLDEGRSRSPSTRSANFAGERLWRVVVEAQEKAALDKEKEKSASLEEAAAAAEKEKEEAVEAAAATATAEVRGQSVHSVRSSPPESKSGGGSGLEPSQRSGNPAVAVAVYTNHRGDQDKRHEDTGTSTSTSTSTATDDATTMSTATTTPATMNSTKRSFAAPKKDSASMKFQRNIVEPSAAISAKSEERKKSGLGGFLQRFSRLRFSGRSKVPRSEVQKKSEPLDHVGRAKLHDELQQQQHQKKKKEPDYIIIPLHPPEDEEKQCRDEVVTLESVAGTVKKNSVEVQRSASSISSNGRAPVSSKPPLPPQPPRFGALSSRPTTGGASAATAATAASSRRRAATDLGNPAAIEMAKARTMQAAQERPVGLLETDLDEAVPSTTSTSTSAGGGKKTRSLLNLNHTSATPRPRPENALHVPQSPVGASHRSPRDDGTASTINQRPHKSMEFLLDKENLHFVKPPENELQKVGERVPSEHELRVQRSLQRLNVPDWYKNSPAARDGFRLKRHSDASQHGGWRALGSKTTSLSSLSSSSTRQPTTGALLSPSPTPPVFSRWSTSLLNSAGSSPASSARSSFNHRQPYLGWRSQERLTNPRTPAERLAQGILSQLQTTNKQQQQQQQQQQQTTNQQLEVRNSIKEVTSAIVHYVQSGQEVGGNGRLSPRPRPEDWDDRGGARSTSPRGSVKLCWMESSFVGTRPVDSPETPISLATETDCCAGCNATGTESCSCVDSATSGLYLDLTPTRDDMQSQHQLQQQSLPLGSLSPSSTSNHHHHQQHHHHHRHLHHQQQQPQQRHHRGSGQSDTDEAMATAALLRNKPSPGSTTLEDVLDSLLGLPSASRTPSPGPGPVVSGASSIRHRTNQVVGQANAKAGKSCSDLRQDLQESARSVMDVQGAASEERASYYVGELVRRKSEGSETIPSRTSAANVVAAVQSRTGHLRHRRVSFDNAQDSNGLMTAAADKIIRCRNNKCTNSTTLGEARRIYKSCHNCTCLYCSRECRRAHWQRHRRTCLHSRAGSLCRQVLSSAKEDPITLKHVSALAMRGYASHGRGAVKCFFSSPEAAEKFIGNGFVDLGEPTYVRWSDLLPSEMGAELYAEVMRLCKSYNPDTRLVLYVAVCVVSEVPTSGAVKWERQLVSRCAKIRLDSACRQPTSSSSASPQGRQQSTSPCNITREMDSPETLVLTSLPGGNGQNTPRRAREISFTNIQRQLRLRGVSLRRHFPQVYRKLCSYVDGSVDKFAPVTIYPRDQASGKSFMCIIMLDAEPERLQLLPTDSSRVRTVDISVEQE